MYVDANVLVYALGDGPYGEPSRSALRQAVEAGAVTSALTMDEVVWALRALGLPEAARRAQAYMSLSGLHIVAADAHVARRALSLVREHGIAPRDAFHAATAIQHGRSVLSADPDFDAVPGIKRVAVDVAGAG